MSGSLRIITGAGGFIGGALLRRWQNVSRENRDFRVLGCDFRAPFMHPDTLLDWLSAHHQISIECIVHLGACTDTRENDRAYLERVNSGYTKALWEICSKRQIPLFYASSAATYGDGSLGYNDAETEIQALKPLNPYAESKQIFDLYALERERAGVHPPRWAGFKFFNVYGFDERLKGPMASVVHQSFEQIRKQGSVRLFESDRIEIPHGHQKRDFVFVGDVISMIEFAVKYPRRLGIVNVGSGKARTFLDLAHAAFDALSVPRKIEWIPMPEILRGRYQYLTEAPLEKLRAAGYASPTTSLEEGVRQTIAALKETTPKNSAQNLHVEPDHQSEIKDQTEDGSRLGSRELPL